MSSQPLGTCGEHKLEVPPIDNHDKTQGHRLQRAQWLRAAILGANDGLLSTTSLMLGVGAAKEDQSTVILSGLAGAVAGACSMAVGEFVSVATQRDIEMVNGGASSKNIAGATGESPVTRTNVEEPNVGGAIMSPDIESSAITPGRRLPVMSPGRSPMIRVITEDLNASTKEVIVNVEEKLPNPLKAAAASAVAFMLGSLVPLATAVFIRENETRMAVLAVVTSIALAMFGAVGAHLGGSRVGISAIRVLIGGWIAMVVTYGLLKPFEGGEKRNDVD